MSDHLLSCKSGSLMLGEDARQYREFFSVEFRIGFAGTTSYGIGVYSEGHGLVPHILLLPEQSKVILGFNQEAVCVDVAETRLAFRLRLDSLFRSFIRLVDPCIILAFHEIGVVAIDEEGNEKWSYTKDIIEDCAIGQGHLQLQFLDEPSVHL